LCYGGEIYYDTNIGLLQYRSDKMLCEFADAIGEEKARLFYQMCLEVMNELTVIN